MLDYFRRIGRMVKDKYIIQMVTTIKGIFQMGSSMAKEL